MYDRYLLAEKLLQDISIKAPAYQIMASTVAEGPSLTAEQTAALFDILTHHETYREIEGFKSAQAVINYGFPFTRTPKAVASLSGGKSATATPASTAPSTPRTRTPAPPEDEEEDDNLVENGQHGEPSTSPILQSLLTRMVLPLPGVRDLPRDFWSVRVQGLLSRLGDAELSESYDKGALGTRKMLATGSSGLIEMIARGTLGGVRSTGRGREGDVENSKKVDDFYDHTKAEDLERAWDDIVEALVYGDLVDDMVEYFAKTDDLEAHSPAVKAAAEYAIIQYVPFTRPYSNLCIISHSQTQTSKHTSKTKKKILTYHHYPAWPLSSTTSSSSPPRASTYSS